MPAASSGRAPTPAPALPHTWRPYGARIAAAVLGLMLIAVCAFVWVSLDEDVRRQFTFLQRATLVLMGLLLLGSYYALVRSKVTASEEGLVVVNGFRTRAFEWSQVIAVSLRRGAPWGTLDVSDGTTVSLIGVQGSDGERARKAVREIRAVLAEHTID